MGTMIGLCINCTILVIKLTACTFLIWSSYGINFTILVIKNAKTSTKQYVNEY